KHRAESLELRKNGKQAIDEGLGELQNQASLLDAPVVDNVAHPVMGQVWAGHDKIARLEVTDEVADKIAAGRLGDEVDLVFGMKVPPHRMIGISVRPHLEGLAGSYLDDFQIGL